jgi:ABC-type branched-subunit amino acid transport system substrate-binding protein
VGRVALGRASACALAVLAIAGCGSQSKSTVAGGAPTVSLWVSATASDYRQVAAGTKLALAERGGRAGVFRVNYAGKQVADDAARATADAVSNARTSLQDTQAGAVITNVASAQAEPAITLLNEAGIATVALGDEALKRVACSSRSDIYPNGHETAVVVTDAVPMPLAFRARFLARLGFTPTDVAWSSYRGASAVLASLGSADVKTDDSPPRLDRDALAAELVQAHGACA